MKTSLIKNLILGTTLATGVVAMTWNGGATLQSAKQTISGYVSTIGIFKENETKLSNKINTLKKAKIELEKQLLEKDGNIKDITAKLEEVNSQIQEYETKFNALQLELDNANLEITKANNEAKELQDYIDTLATTPQPKDITVALGDGLEDEEPTPDPIKTWDGLSAYQDEFIRIEYLSSTKKIRIKSINNEEGINPQKVYFDGLQKAELDYDVTKDIATNGKEKMEVTAINGDKLVTIQFNIK